MKIVANIILFTLLLFPALGFADTLDGGIVMITNETYARPLSIIGSVIEATPNTGRTVFICFGGRNGKERGVSLAGGKIEGAGGKEAGHSLTGSSGH